MAAYTTIDNPELYFQTVLYTGNGSANNAITLGGSEDMQPDLVWIKNRDTTDFHCMFDSIRGPTYIMHSNTRTVNPGAVSGTLDAFQTDGFRVDDADIVNTDTENYVAWCWKGLGSTGASNTAGTINTISTSALPAAGFTILSYLGNFTADQSVGHGLGLVPGMMLTKEPVTAYGWQVYNQGLGGTQALYWQDTNAAPTSDDFWEDTDPTSTLVTLGVDASVNYSGGKTYISYVWAPIQGYSRFGIYDGNGDANGTFVYTGFRPAWVMLKSSDSTSDWFVFDNKRLGYNGDNNPLLSNEEAAEATTDMVDLLSNGFKLRIATDPNVAETYVYYAFAEAPFANSNGLPCNAR